MKRKTFKEKFYDKFPGLYLLLVVLIRVIKRDKNYINKIFSLDSSPDYIKVERKGNENKGIIVYLIGDLDKSVGFCAVIMDTLKHLIYAEDHGLKPVIKYSDNFVYFDEEKNQENSNPFEYYFNSVNVDNIDKSANLVFAKPSDAQYSKERYMLDAYEKEHFYSEKMKDVVLPIVRKYLIVKSEIIDECRNFLVGKGKVLGVHYRGTDFKVGYNLHPVMARDEQYLVLIDKRINSGEYDCIFLATDDVEICKKFEQRYENIIIYYPDVIRSNGTVSVAYSESERPYHHYKLGYEIVRDMYTLSLCNGLIAGKSHVSFLANLYKLSRNEEFDSLDIIDNGMNVNDINFYDSISK